MTTPTRMGQQSSVCQRVLERLDAGLPETGDNGPPAVTGKAANAARLARLLRGSDYPPVR